MRPLIAAATAIAILSACVEPEPEASTTVVFAPINPPPCDDYGCTSNTPVMGAYRFIEIHEQGALNNAGLYLDGLWKNGFRYKPDVAGARLTATREDFPLLENTELTGAYFLLKNPNDPAGTEHRIYIAHVSNTVHYWYFDIGQTVQTYRLKYVPPGAAPADGRALCNKPPADSASGDGNAWVGWTTLDEAILYTGDRYDMQTKKLGASSPTAAGDWFNIACAGSAIAKLFLNRFTYASSFPLLPPPSAASRGDLLSMYTGNVCGSGRSYTVAKTPIDWGSYNGWRDLSALSESESVWGGGRAKCLDTWRLELTPQQEAQMVWDCGGAIPKPCDELAGFPDDWTEHGTIISGVP